MMDDDLAAEWRFVLPAEAARRLGTSVQTVRRRADRGDLLSIRTPVGRLIYLEPAAPEGA